MPAGLLFGAAIILLFILTMTDERGMLRRSTMIAASTLCMLVVPFVLPNMHERYFFAGNLLTIIYAFYFPAHYYVPLIASMAEFFSYGPFLFGEQWAPVSLPVLAFAMLFSIVTVARQVHASLRASGTDISALTVSNGGESD
jgi:Gpi18-like mannosyltransferase